MHIHYWPSPHWVDDAAHAAILEVSSAAERDIRHLLPALVDDVYLLVNQTEQVIAETGDGGFAIGPHCIRWDVDPRRGVETVARSQLRSTLFHECHHAVRLLHRPEEAAVVDWPTVTVFEGLASAFEAASGAERSPYTRYEPEVIEDWAAELLAQPVDDTWPQWKFQHPDGRRSIAYKVGTWFADRATERSGRTAADLVWASPAEVIDLAGCSHLVP